MTWEADRVSTSDADITACGLMRSAPVSCAVASGRSAEAYPTRRRGRKSLSSRICCGRGLVASRRSGGTSGEASEAPTTADWCAGFLEETTAIRSGFATPTDTPAQSLARA